MAVITLNNSVDIGDYKKPYFVAEVNSSHNGDIALAKEMIDKAKEIGCDCVKFQSWSHESLYSQSYYANNPIAKRIVGKFALQLEQQRELALYWHLRPTQKRKLISFLQNVRFLILK